jgi:hypothetical protein
VHTVFTGNDTPEIPEPPSPVTNEGPAEPPNTTSDTQGTSTTPVSKIVVQSASCDLCDSPILGDRFVSFIHTVRNVSAHATHRNVSTAQILMCARHAMQSYPLSTLVTALHAYMIRKT